MIHKSATIVSLTCPRQTVTDATDRAGKKRTAATLAREDRRR